MKPEQANVLTDIIKSIVKETVAEVLAQHVGNGNGKPEKLLFNTAEAAELLSVPVTWLSAAARKGLIACVRTGHYVQFARRDLEEFIEKNKSGAVGS